MDDAIGAIAALFLSDLPDSRQELSIQLNSHFPAFSRLPLELRLIVWRLALPKGKPLYLMNKTKTKRPRSQRHPIGSRVNQESRKETLQHYVILYQRKKKPHRPTTLIPMYFFDPKVDTLHLDLYSVLCIRESVYWLKNLFDASAVGLTTVKSIEIPVSPWSGGRDGVIKPRDMEIGAIQTLQHFCGLEQIILRCPNGIIIPRHEEGWGTGKWADLRDLIRSRAVFENFFKTRGALGVKIIVMDGVGKVLE
ncbi:hypothetical protein DL98DRAFT_592868 [Cadophora sp. DSE1049]|nr:hypothetical protein DL98DRAFT_592868 [Cadophora sp. DSE1049]